MANTVVGIFENESDAQQAQNYLLSNGYADGDVDIKIASYKDDRSGVSDNDDDFFERIGNFFKELFGGNEEESRLYAEAGKRGTIVTVHALSSEEAESAASILDRFGAQHVKENNAQYTTGQSPDANKTESQPWSYENQEDNKTFQTGAIPLKSRVFEREIQENFRLRQQVATGRTPVDDSTPDFPTSTVDEFAQPVRDRASDPEVDVEDLTGKERVRRTGLDL